VTEPTRSAPHRTARALVLGCTTLVVGVVAHLVGGRAPTAGGVGAALLALTALAWPLTAREHGWLTIAGVQLAGQQAVHAFLGSSLLGSPVLGSTGEHHHASAAVVGALPVDLMLWGHVVAAALVAVWLRHGERRTWTAARRAARTLVARWRRLLALFDRVDAPSVDGRTPSRHDPRPQRPAPLRYTVVRRGPPLPA
jgi:hypothetical protein